MIRTRMPVNHVLIWSALLIANLGALVYVIVRYYDGSLTTTLFSAGVFGVSWACSFVLARTSLSKNVNPGLLLMGVVGAIPCFVLFGAAIEKRFLSNLVALRNVDTQVPDYYTWKPDGERYVEPMSLALERFHRKGDETAHLAAAMALRKTWANPSRIAEMIHGVEKHDRSYWLRRALAGHPPGLAALYATVCLNPPFARVWAFMLFLASVLVAYWAGNKWSDESRFGLLTATCFAFMPNLNWWHMTSVSSDVPPAVFTFLAFGLAGCAVQAQHTGSRSSPLFAIGLLFGVATFITYTASLAALGTAILMWASTPKESRKRIMWLLILAPSACAVLLGTAYSRIAIPACENVLIARLNGLTEGNNSTFADPVAAIVTFVTRWPMDLGVPLTIFMVLIPIWFIFVCSGIHIAPRFQYVVAALAVLIPASSFFWPEIRFAFPGLLVVLTGLGFKQFWEDISDYQKSLMISSIAAFGFSKYVLHSLLIANPA